MSLRSRSDLANLASISPVFPFSVIRRAYLSRSNRVER